MSPTVNKAKGAEWINLQLFSGGELIIDFSHKHLAVMPFPLDGVILDK